jgi:DAK2 domain fusion protein YloV
MQTAFMDGHLFKQMIVNGSMKLRANVDRINELNVFPVPDGDTGSNMYATIQAGAKSLQTINDPAIGNVAKIVARGMLMGARGNSGVILSQLFSGLATGLKGLDKADCEVFSKALRQGVEQAYSAVINPVEGTILTVAREGADVAMSAATEVKDFNRLFELYLIELNASLERTPDLLPILKEVGVIDSGGAGYIEIVNGMVGALNGIVYDEPKDSRNQTAYDKPKMNMDAFKDAEDFGYCTEFIMQIEKTDSFVLKDFIEMITPLGGSLVAVQDENILKVHIHTQTPGDVLNLGQRFGFFINMKIENMSVQHTEVVLHEPTSETEPCECGHDHTTGSTPKIKKKYAIIAVVNGDGLKETFLEMGCDYIIEGGQTMNPAVEDFVNACNSIAAEHIIIIPNNKNVLLSAETAAKVIENKNVRVLPAKTISQGYAALTMFDGTQDIDANIVDMKAHIKNVKTGEVTYSIRDSVNNGLHIQKDDFMGIFDGEIVVSKPSRVEVVRGLIHAMVDAKSEIITIMYGKDVEASEVDTLVADLSKNHSYEIETIDGGQDIYSYIISVE